MFALTEELLLGADLYFAIAGTTIDTETVAIDTKPDNDPTSNWTDRQFGCINQVQYNPATKTETRECGRGAGKGGYYERQIQRVLRDEFNFTTLEYNEVFHRLCFGLTGMPTPGTGQVPFADRTREIFGWMRMVIYKEDGSTLATLEMWCKLMLGDVPDMKNESGSPVYRVEFIGSGSNDLDDINFAA